MFRDLARVQIAWKSWICCILYTACTRAIEKLKISGIEMDDGGIDLREKMELHPKSVLWQARLGAVCFPAERVTAARLEVDKLKFKRKRR